MEGKTTLAQGKPDHFTKQEQHCIFIFDDSQSNLCDSQEIMDLFTKNGPFTTVIF